MVLVRIEPSGGTSRLFSWGKRTCVQTRGVPWAPQAEKLARLGERGREGSQTREQPTETQAEGIGKMNGVPRLGVLL